nr:MAG TPA: hypothetical protein [Caudoviricetes sp.]
MKHDIYVVFDKKDKFRPQSVGFMCYYVSVVLLGKPHKSSKIFYLLAAFPLASHP